MTETSFDNEYIYKIYHYKIMMINSFLKLFTNETEMKESSPECALLEAGRFYADTMQKLLDNCFFLLLKLAMDKFLTHQTITEHFEDMEKIRDKALSLTKRFNLGN